MSLFALAVPLVLPVLAVVVAVELAFPKSIKIHVNNINILIEFDLVLTFSCGGIWPGRGAGEETDGY